jgi:hypothetical protein
MRGIDFVKKPGAKKSLRQWFLPLIQRFTRGRVYLVFSASFGLLPFF